MSLMCIYIFILKFKNDISGFVYKYSKVGKLIYSVTLRGLLYAR